MPPANDADAAPGDGKAMRRTAASLTLLLASCWLLTAGLALGPWAWSLYRVSFAETVAHRLAGRLDQLRWAPSPRILLFGASTTREGFSAPQLASLIAGSTVVNGGLAGGSVDVLAAGLEILEASGVRPELVVVGLHGFMLRRQDPDLIGRGYTDLLDRRRAAALLPLAPAEQRARVATILDRNTVFPPARHGRQLDRWLRFAVDRLQRTLRGSAARGRADFEREPRDLLPTPEFRARVPEDTGEVMWQRWVDAGYLESDAYADARTRERLDDILGRLAACCQDLVVVRLPESSRLRAALPALADHALEVVLAGHPTVRVLDARRQLADDDLIDLAHASAVGRERLTRWLADELGRYHLPAGR